MAIPPLATLVVLLHAAGTYRLALIGDYIGKTLWPYLETQVGPLPSWQTRVAERQTRTPSAVAKALFVDFPAMILFIGASVFALARLGEHEELWWMGCFMTVLAIAVPLRIGLLVRRSALS